MIVVICIGAALITYFTLLYVFGKANESRIKVVIKNTTTGERYSRYATVEKTEFGKKVWFDEPIVCKAGDVLEEIR